MNDALRVTQVAVTNLVDETLILKDALQAQLSDTDVTVLGIEWVPVFDKAPDHILLRLKDGAGKERNMLVKVSVREVGLNFLNGSLS